MDLALSAALIAGQRRRRAQACLDALCAQTVSERMEIVVVDVGPATAPPLRHDGDRVRYIRRPDDTSWSQARAEAVRRAASPVVAFIEDHCVPAPGWAEALIETHKGPWAAVTYAFTNGSADTWLYRSIMMAEYGFWQHPARHGPTKLLPGNNVAYKRELLLGLGANLEEIMAVDFNAYEALRQRGHDFFADAVALVAHQFYADAALLPGANVAYARLLAANRVSSQGWGWPRRIFYAVAAPLVLPVLRTARLAWTLRDRPALWGTFLLSMPTILTAFVSGAVGETWGYLFGAGESERRLAWLELAVPRNADARSAEE